MPKKTKEIILSKEDVELFFRLCRKRKSDRIARQDPNFAMHQLLLELVEGDQSFGTTLDWVLDSALNPGPLQTRKEDEQELAAQNA